MAQQTDALLGRYGEEFEDRNAGVSEGEPEEAGPGMVGKILTTYTDIKERVGGHGSTPSTPTGVQAQQQQQDLDGVPHEQAHPNPVHNDAVGAGDRVETAGPVGSSVSRGGSARSVESASPRGSGHFIRDAGTPASPKLPRKDLGERIIDKLPGTHANPYSVGLANPYTEGGDRSAVPTSPSAQRSSGPMSPSLIGKLKNIFTGQKPLQGTATENAISGTAGTTGEQQPTLDGYAQSPTARKNRDIYEKVKEKFGHRGPDAGSAETWPSPNKPDISSIPSATRADAEGHPIEGPTQPVAEDTKKEGLMTKIIDKLHIHEQSPSPSATTADIGTGTATATTDPRPLQETGLPTPTRGGPETTIGTATGSTEN